MTLPQPNRTPAKLNKARSSLYARRLTLVRTWASCSEIPGGRAFLRLLTFLSGLPLPSSRVAGIVSKYGSYLVSA